MSYRFKLERRRFTILYARQLVASINHNYEIVCRCECREIYRRARVHRARYYERRWSLRKNVTSRYDKSPTCHAQIQFYEARSRRMEVHQRRWGTPRNMPGLRHDGGWIPPGVQAFGDLAGENPRSPLDGEKGVYRRTREGGSRGYPPEDGKSYSDENETGTRIPASTFRRRDKQCSGYC